ncbi:MAG: D-alanyl-D-alanine carboxypeptidase [Alphaproteobacteria bacterium]|nr:D-alanyl-D-alanine carboxypeptidase [Alphaproteobacteria bacterium]
MMKTKDFFLPIIILLAVVFAPQPSFARYASIVVNETTGEVLYSRSADKQLYPASLTKVMTLYLLFEALDEGRVTMDTRMKVSRVAAGRSPSKLGLRVGSTIAVKDALLALVTKSANDAATVISEHLGGTEREFAKKMTRKARALGMSRTTFRNASGLPHSKQRSTARDMARLAVAIRKDFPQYFHFFKTQRFSYRGKKYKNHNKLLSQFRGTDGIKTGYIRASGFNLIATVERDGTRLVGVVFGGRSGASRNKHMIYLLDKQFRKLPKFKGPVVRPAKQDRVKVPPKRPRTVAVFAARTPPPKPDTSTDLPALDDPVVARAPDPSNWGIQVGSFSRRANAHLAARDARQAARDILSRQPAKLRPVVYGSVTFWQVQFHGFDEDRAREACVELLQSGMACIAVPSPQV